VDTGAGLSCVNVQYVMKNKMQISRLASTDDHAFTIAILFYIILYILCFIVPFPVKVKLAELECTLKNRYSIVFCKIYNYVC